MHIPNVHSCPELLVLLLGLWVCWPEHRFKIVQKGYEVFVVVVVFNFEAESGVLGMEPHLGKSEVTVRGANWRGEQQPKRYWQG